MPARKITTAAQSQKGQGIPELSEDDARAYLERLRWPDGNPVCPHCGSVDAYRMTGKTPRPGLCRCRDCDKQFTVSVGTIYEGSHIPLAKWVKAFHLMASSKKGISALQLQRNLGIGSYKTAWFMAHRIREAMRTDAVAGELSGEVQTDETYVGGKPRKGHGQPRPKRGRGTDKACVLVMVETDGKARSHPIDRLTSDSLKGAMKEVIAPDAAIVTDELPAYPRAAADFTGGHYTVNHRSDQYVRPDGRHTNTAESFFALIKRGHYGVFHQLSKKHLHRYCDEFSFRWNGRKLTDSERREQAMRQVEGKRLFYKSPKSVAS
ncbi:MAG TPA: IS1595 family transposase [Humisphaera sp.]